jgi:hypothetical protein
MDQKKQVTKWLIIVTALVWIVWDVFVWWYGVQATISKQFGEWLASSMWVTVAFALLVGHLMGEMPRTPGELNRWIAFAVAFGVGVFATRAM